MTQFTEIANSGLGPSATCSSTSGNAATFAVMSHGWITTDGRNYRMRAPRCVSSAEVNTVRIIESTPSVGKLE